MSRPVNTKPCCAAGCDRPFYAKGFCRTCYRRWWRAQPRKPKPEPPVGPGAVACPDDLVPLVTQLVENDAGTLFRVLWQTIGEWHLAEFRKEQLDTQAI